MLGIAGSILSCVKPRMPYRFRTSWLASDRTHTGHSACGGSLLEWKGTPRGECVSQGAHEQPNAAEPVRELTAAFHMATAEDMNTVSNPQLDPHAIVVVGGVRSRVVLVGRIQLRHCRLADAAAEDDFL